MRSSRAVWSGDDASAVHALGTGRQRRPVGDRRLRDLPDGCRQAAEARRVGSWPSTRWRPTGRAFVWIGLHEPTEAAVGRDRRALRAAPARGRGCGARPSAPEAGAVRRQLFAVVKTVHYDDTLPGGDGGGRRDRRGDGVPRGELRDHRPARRARRPAARCASRLRGRPGAVGARPVRRAARGPRQRSSTGYVVVVPGRCSRTSTRWRPRCSPAANRDRTRTRCTCSSARCSSCDAHPRRWPPRSTLSASGRSTSSTPKVRDYFRDVDDHLSEVVDQRELLRRTADHPGDREPRPRVGLQNEDMRKISAWVAIAAVPTMVAGIYGMNFEPHAGTALALRLPPRRDRDVCICAGSLPLVQAQRLALHRVRLTSVEQRPARRPTIPSRSTVLPGRAVTPARPSARRRAALHPTPGELGGRGRQHLEHVSRDRPPSRSAERGLDQDAARAAADPLSGCPRSTVIPGE